MTERPMIELASGAPDWLRGLLALEQRREDGVLVTVAATRGHTPREAGAKLLVSRTESWGSVGGGNLEASAVARARERLATGRPLAGQLATGTSGPELLTLRLTDAAPNEYGRQCCGGEVTLLLELLAQARPAVAVFGLGHVGLELALLLSRQQLDLHLTDSRRSQLDPARLAPLHGGAARIHLHHAPIPELVLEDLPAGASVVILTHDHAEDAALCDAALRRPGLGYIGLIGSAAKWRRFQAQLRELGHSQDDLRRITSPTGLPGLTGKQPAVIALGVAAQLMQTLPDARTQTPRPDPVTHDR